MKLLRKNSLLIVFLIAITAKTTSTPLNTNVINGDFVFDGDFPFMGLLIRRYYTELEDMECGCTLIHPGWAVTAAHCMLEPWADFDDVDVVLNLSNIRDPWDNAQRIKVDTVYFHPGYKNENYPGGSENDIALLHLEEETSIKPVNLAEPQDSILYQANTSAKILGWGITRIGSIWPGRPDLMRQGDVLIIGYPGCYDTIGQENIRHPLSEFCAGVHTAPVVGSAGGDSGGPLLVKRQEEWVQVGVVSRGNGGLYTNIGAPGIYSKISFYYPWITEVIKNTNQDQLVEWKPNDFFDYRVFNDKIEVFLLRAYDFDSNVKVFSLSGKLIYNEKINKHTSKILNINTHHLKNEIIVLAFFLENKILSQKIFIQ